MMQLSSFELAIERDRQDSFVTVSQSYIDSALAPLYHGHMPPVVPLRLTRPDGVDVYVGCLVQRAHRQQKMKLLCSQSLATDLGLSGGDQVMCAPAAQAPRATMVLVAPLTVDDSEVVEGNALRIESELLRQLQVVFPGQVVTVAIYAGVHARVRVQRIECGEGNKLAATTGFAVMFEGTHFVIATRARPSAEVASDEAAAGQAKCHWAFLRGLPCTAHEEQQCEKAAKAAGGDAVTANYFVVTQATAASFGWTEGLPCRLVDAASLVGLEDGKITPAFLRSEAVRLARVQILPPRPNPLDVTASTAKNSSHVESCDEDDGGAMPVAEVGFLAQATNLLVLPTLDDEHRVADAAADVAVAAVVEQGGGSAVAGAGASHFLASPSAAPALCASALPTLRELEEVHGDAPGELLSYLAYLLKQRPENSDGGDEGAATFAHTPHNVLLCGGKGYGKTTIVATVLRHLRNEVHTVTLECVSGRNFLPRLRSALLECTLCAPAVLVLDGVDNIAPVQKEGNVQAMTAATRATLEAVLTTFTQLFSFAWSSTVVVIGTCASREGISEALRNAWCFQKFITVNALTRVSRCALLSQLFPEASKREVSRMATNMDNYTPFDVTQVAIRIRAAGTAVSASLVDRAERATASFTPLAHAGIKFLKGDKLDWDSVGGLAEAKKVLHDTLVLPMRHPKLFAKLPLKTRSGILLYGASGCGKTFVLESLVKAENINCIVVNGPEVFGKYIGQSEQKIRDVFERAQAAAPCVVFFDEFDSVAPQRGVDNSGVTDRVVNQLLCYLDGVEGRKDVYVVAASSRPDLIDAALLRPGRLDKAVQCPVPPLADRAAILRSLLAGTPAAADLPPAAVDRLAAETENWTPADLSAVVSTANMLVNQRVMEQLASEVPAADDAAGTRRLGEEDTQAYFIANVAAGVSRDKIMDALKTLHEGVHSGGHSAAVKAIKMTEADLLEALKATRPSLSDKDIAKQERIHALFSKGESMAVPKPGTKLTSS